MGENNRVERKGNRKMNEKQKSKHKHVSRFFACYGLRITVFYFRILTSALLTKEVSRWIRLKTLFVEWR